MKNKTLLFTTSTCNKCTDAKILAHRLNIDIVQVDTELDGIMLADKYKVKMVPTFIVIDNEGRFDKYNYQEFVNKNGTN
jgi:glutaredoxin